MSEEGNPPGTTPKAPPAETVSKTEYDKIKGQYTALQRKISKKEDLSNTEMQAKIDELTEANKTLNDGVRQTALDQLKAISKELAKEFKDADLKTLRALVKSNSILSSGVPPRKPGDNPDNKKDQVVGYRTLNETKYTQR